jgi:hypothetical protein
MKRVIRSWPYVVVVAVVYGGWLVLAQLPLPAEEVKNLLIVYGGMFSLTVTAGAGAVLAYRRGYDWVAVLTCVVAYAVFAAIGDLAVLGQPPAWASIGAAGLAYILVGHVGIGAALGVKELGSTKPPKPARR